MTDLIRNLRPLLHPMVVHFPIALLFASVALDWLGVWLRRLSLTRAGFYTLVLGTAGAGVAALSGPDHAGGDATVQALLVSHQSFALMTVALAVALLVIRFAAPRGLRGRWALAYLASTLLLLVTLSLTGYYGGELTYRQGIGVATTITTPAVSPTGDQGGAGSVPVKPLVVLLGIFSAGLICAWPVAGRMATGGYFAEWWQALRHTEAPGAPLWTLRLTSDTSPSSPMLPAAGASATLRRDPAPPPSRTLP